jgi:hypothetical protein
MPVKRPWKRRTSLPGMETDYSMRMGQIKNRVKHLLSSKGMMKQ